MEFKNKDFSGPICVKIAKSFLKKKLINILKLKKY